MVSDFKICLFMEHKPALAWPAAGVNSAGTMPLGILFASRLAFLQDAAHVSMTMCNKSTYALWSQHGVWSARASAGAGRGRGGPWKGRGAGGQQ